MPEKLLRVEDLTVRAQTEKGAFDIVSGISFSMAPGEILGIVGESGCGKSMTALSIAGLLARNVSPSAGRILFGGRDLRALPREEIRRIQGKELSMIFQEPMTSLNPLMKIGRQVSENLRLHSGLPKREIRGRTVAALRRVGLPEPERLLGAYPHELSGGMRQRVMIALAVICRPKLIIADEPTTALDVTIQAQILGLLREINREYGCAILFISHDLGVVSQLCSRILVMYAGSIVEEGAARDIFRNPAHEYTKGLIGSIPTREMRGRRLANIPGRVPAPSEKTVGCPFAPRCGKACGKCLLRRPEPTEVSPGHWAGCIRAQRESGAAYAFV